MQLPKLCSRQRGIPWLWHLTEICRSVCWGLNHIFNFRKRLSDWFDRVSLFSELCSEAAVLRELCPLEGEWR